MADRLVVDLEGLAALDGRLRSIVGRLDDAKVSLGGFDGALGDARVRDALHDFEHHWRDGRKHICQSAQSLAEMLSDAVDTFRQTDAHLGASIDKAVQSGSR